MLLVAYARPVSPAAALRERVAVCCRLLYLPTDVHSLFVNKSTTTTTLIGLSLLHTQKGRR
jgi:hypothetical protein